MQRAMRHLELWHGIGSMPNTSPSNELHRCVISTRAAVLIDRLSKSRHRRATKMIAPLLCARRASAAPHECYSLRP
eukprot:14527066-Alexandrium_andersonii.AAC.1